MRNIHLIAACGVGMASLAGMLKEKEFRVTGSDANVYPPMSTQLEELGITLLSPYAAENIPLDADLVIVGNAVSRDNPECLEAARRGVPVMSMPQALAGFFIDGKESVVVAGTHGKTTTTSLLAFALHRLGEDPSFLVGGVPRNFPVSYRVGTGPRFVVEGDEYDTAWFDKGPKFLHYLPKVVIITSVEFDHADIYRDLPHLVDSFRKLVRLIPADGMLVGCADYPEVVAVAAEAACPVAFYSTGPVTASEVRGESWAVRSVREEGGLTKFSLEGERERHEFATRLPGRHNAANAAAAALVLLRLGYGAAQAANAFCGFEGVRRRQEFLGEFGGVAVVDDFAHHPTAVRGTIQAVRARYPARRIVAVFEPRSNTSRRRIFQEEFAGALAEADSVIVAGVFGAEKIPPGERLDPEGLVEAVNTAGREAVYINDVDRIVDRLSQVSRPGDLVLIMSNGGFGGIQGKLTGMLSSRQPQTDPR